MQCRIQGFLNLYIYADIFFFLCMHSLAKRVFLDFHCYYENDIFMHLKSKFKQYRRCTMKHVSFHPHTQFHCPEVTIPGSFLRFFLENPHLCLYIYLSKTHTHSHRYRDTMFPRERNICALHFYDSPVYG